MGAEKNATVQRQKLKKIRQKAVLQLRQLEKKLGNVEEEIVKGVTDNLKRIFGTIVYTAEGGAIPSLGLRGTQHSNPLIGTRNWMCA